MFDDSGWGVASLTGSNNTSNPYQSTNNYTSDSIRNNDKDQIVKAFELGIEIGYFYQFGIFAYIMTGVISK